MLATIARRGYSLEYGARNLTRILKNELLEKIAYLSLDKGWNDARFLVCRLQDDAIEVTLEAADANAAPMPGLVGASENEQDKP